MALIDDNNSGIPAGAGKDPLEELDKELDSLREQMHGEGLSPSAKAPAPAERADKPAEEPRQDEPPRPAQRFKDEDGSKSPRTAIIVAALIMAVVGIAAGVMVYMMNRSAPQPEPTTVTVNDSELGTVELTPPEDASVNDYEVTNLTRDDNGYYTYTVNGKKVSEMGVDLSEFQGEVDFNAVKASGIDFVMLRLGGRTYGSGSLYEDTAFAGYYDQAKAAGLKIGAYFFSQAITPDEAADEARYSVELLNGRALDYPIAFDWEAIDDDAARTDGITGGQLTEVAAEFCNTVEQSGYRSMVYASTSLILQTYDFDIMKEYDFWLADYRSMPEQNSMYYHYKIWQYTDQGVVPGIEGDVDLNLCLNAANG